MENKYYNNKGKYEEFANEAQKLVPDEGPAETVEGEIMRAAAKMYYRFYNDGDYPQGANSCGMRNIIFFLQEMNKKYHFIDPQHLNKMESAFDENKYSELLEEMLDSVVLFIGNKKGVYTVKETELDYLDKKYRNYKEEDYHYYEDDSFGHDRD